MSNLERSSEFESELRQWKCHVLPLHYDRIMVVLPRIELGLNDYESSTLTVMLQNLGTRGEIRTHNRLLRREMNYPVVLLLLRLNLLTATLCHYTLPEVALGCQQNL